MPFPFGSALRRDIQDRLSGFQHGSFGAQSGDLKHAAVAIAIVPAGDSGDAAFLLTRRAATLRGHAGQWALPGGRCDPGETKREAALRELHEELGLRLAVTDVLGTLDDYPTRSGYLITPVVAWAAEGATVVPNPAEVASVHRVTLEALTHPETVSFFSIQESERQVVRLRLAGDNVHAPTAAMLYQFGELLNGRHTRVVDLEQPVWAWR